MEKKYGKLHEKFREKNQTPHTIRDEKNNRIESSSQILEDARNIIKIY